VTFGGSDAALCCRQRPTISPVDVRWVEFYGGPDDGEMEEMPTWLYEGTGLPVFEHHIGWRRRDGGPVVGRYRPAGLAAEGLPVVRLQWVQGERLRSS
jgi:hypothetical protein